MATKGARPGQDQRHDRMVALQVPDLLDQVPGDALLVGVEICGKPLAAHDVLDHEKLVDTVDGARIKEPSISNPLRVDDQGVWERASALLLERPVAKNLLLGARPVRGDPHVRACILSQACALLYLDCLKTLNTTEEILGMMAKSIGYAVAPHI